MRKTAYFLEEIVMSRSLDLTGTKEQFKILKESGLEYSDYTVNELITKLINMGFTVYREDTLPNDMPESLVEDYDVELETYDHGFVCLEDWKEEYELTEEDYDEDEVPDPWEPVDWGEDDGDEEETNEKK